MRYLRVVAVVGIVAAIFAAVVAIYMNYGPLREAPLAWVFVAAGALLTVMQALRSGTRSAASPVPTTSRAKYVVPHTLPPSPAVVGREADLQTITRRIMPGRPGRNRVILLYGDPGVGKTALAIDAARRLEGRFPDGALFAWLGGRATVESVLRVFVTALQSKEEQVPKERDALEDRYAMLTRRKRRKLLVILDDAPNAEIVEALIPAGDESAVIVTSRTELQLPDAGAPLKVEPLASRDAIRVFAGLVGEKRIELEPEAAQMIVASAQGSPLAINVAGTSLAARPNWTLEATLDSARQQLPQAPRDSPRDTSLDLSFFLLTEEEKSAVLWLGQLYDRTFEPWELATLMDEEHERVAWRMCDRLVHLRLLEHVVNDATGIASYRVLEHVVEYARSRADALPIDGDELEARRERLKSQRRERGRRDLAELMKNDVYPEMERGNLSGARNNIRGALAQARLNRERASEAMKLVGLFETGGQHTAEVLFFRQARDAEGLALAALAEVHGELGNLDQSMEMAQAAQRTESPVARPRALRCIGNVQRRQWRLTEAYTTLREALRAAEVLRLQSEQVRILRDTALLFAERRDINRAHRALDQAETVGLREDSRERMAVSLAWARSVVLLSHFTIDRDPEHAREAARVLAEASVTAGKRQQLWLAWIGYQRAQAFRHLGYHEQARRVAVRAAGDFAAMRHRYGAALCRFEQVRSYLDQDEVARALPIMEDARQSLAYCEDRFVEAQAVLTLAKMHLVLARVTDRTREELEMAGRALLELGNDAGWREAMKLLGEANEAMQRKRSGRPVAELPVPGGFWSPTATVTGGS